MITLRCDKRSRFTLSHTRGTAHLQLGLPAVFGLARIASLVVILAIGISACPLDSTCCVSFAP
ncbi:hypothetical protein PENSPDRAFT_650452 [Peniophora sp. CONT]|nr:hypothetical protein PENSPDRAFT_650452 [Peniophora sp. CONT]